MKKPVRSLALLSAAALAAGLTVAGGTAAVASPARQVGNPEVLAKNLAAPLSAAVADDGSVYVTGNFSGTLYHVVPGSAPTTVYQASTKGSEVGAVSVHGDRVVFGITGKSKLLMQMVAGGAPTTLANVGKYEKTKNPDGKTVYGFKGITKACEAKIPKNMGPANYTGIVDSHPYATEQTDTTTYLADAAGNDILSISPTGVIKTVAVLPATKVKISAGAAEANGLPNCTVGHSYKFEPVPTDVELGPDGNLYVSSLPGGPEDGSTGPQGRVYKVNPNTGKVTQVAAGFVSTVDLAVADNGDIYVAQLFTGVVSRIKASNGKVKDFMQLSMPGAIEWTPDFLYATVDALKGLPGRAAPGPKGKLVRIPW
jgi:hypothetical protein